MRQQTNDLLFLLEACRLAVNECEIVRAKISIDSPAMLRLRDLAVAGLPVQLVLYWGIWQRASVGAGEYRFLERLNVLTRAIAANLKVPCELKVIVTDTHAQLNGVPNDVIEAYVASATAAAASVGARADRLSMLMADAPAVPANESPHDFTPPQKWQRLRTILATQAGKLFADAEDRAAAYELANLREGGAVLRAFPLGIFLNTGLPELRPMLCSLPTIHIYTGSGQKTRKPWFEGGGGDAPS